MKKRFIAITLCILLILTGMPMKSFAAEKISAKLIEIKGDVQIIRSGGEKPFKAFLNMKLSEGDRIITSSSATAKIKLDDEVVITLAENTSIYLSELRNSKGSKQSSITLQSGGVGSSIKKKLTDNSRFEIKTPTAVMGVRGTEFFTQYLNGKVDIKVVDGTVEILVNINQEGNVTGIGQGNNQSYRFIVGALQQTNFNEGETAKDLPKNLKPLDFIGLPVPFLERIKEMIKDDSDSIPKVIADTIEEAIKQAISNRENKINDNKLVADEFSSKPGNGHPINIQESNPATLLPDPIVTPTPSPEPDPIPDPDPVVAVKSITINETTIQLEVDEYIALKTIIEPENATNTSIQWSSSDILVAIVDDLGNVTAVSPGTATITATTVDGGKTASITVNVTAVTVPVESISIVQSFIELELGKSIILVATVEPKNATNQYIKWTSSNIEVANVDSEGKVTAVSPGTATITATTVYGGKTASITVTVTTPITTPLEYFEFDLDSEPGEAILTRFITTGIDPQVVLEEILDPIIPSQVDGVPVTAIGDGAFQETGITSVIIPEVTRSIGNSAFAGNPGLNIIEIGSGVEIGYNSFGYDDIFREAYDYEYYSAGGIYYKGSTDFDSYLMGSWSQVKPEEYFDIRYMFGYIYDQDTKNLNLSENENTLSLNLVSYIENIAYDLFILDENYEYIELEYGEDSASSDPTQRNIYIEILAEGEIKIKIVAKVKDYSDHIISFTLIAE